MFHPTLILIRILIVRFVLYLKNCKHIFFEIFNLYVIWKQYLRKNYETVTIFLRHQVLDSRNMVDKNLVMHLDKQKNLSETIPDKSRLKHAMFITYWCLQSFYIMMSYLTCCFLNLDKHLISEFLGYLKYHVV